MVSVAIPWSSVLYYASSLLSRLCICLLLLHPWSNAMPIHRLDLWSVVDNNSHNFLSCSSSYFSFTIHAIVSIVHSSSSTSMCPLRYFAWLSRTRDSRLGSAMYSLLALHILILCLFSIWIFTIIVPLSLIGIGNGSFCFKFCNLLSESLSIVYMLLPH